MRSNCAAHCQKRPWLVLLVLLVTLEAGLLNGQIPNHGAGEKRLVLSNAILIPGSTPGNVRAVFVLNGTGCASHVKTEVKLVFETRGGPVPAVPIPKRMAPVGLSGSTQETNYVGKVDLEFATVTITPGLKARLRISGTYYCEGVKYSEDYMGALMDVPGNGNTGTLVVNVRMPDPEAFGDGRVPTKEEMDDHSGVWLNGVLKAKIDSSGRAIFTLPPGKYEYFASAGWMSNVGENVNVEKDQIVYESVTLDEGKDFSDYMGVDSPECVEDLLNADFQSFSLQFYSSDPAFPLVIDEAAPATLDHLTVSYQGATGSNEEEIQDLFRPAADGSLVATKIETLRKIFVERANGSPITIRGYFHGEEFVYGFQMGFSKIKGRLQAPPSRPTLSLANQSVAVWLMESDHNILCQSSADGSFELPVMVPLNGMASLQVTVVGSDGVNFYGNAVFSTREDQNVTVTLLGSADIINRVNPFQLQGSKKQRNAGLAQAALNGKSPLTTSDPRAATFLVSLIVDGKQWDLPLSIEGDKAVAKRGILNFPRGSKVLSMKHSVQLAAREDANALKNYCFSIWVQGGELNSRVFSKTNRFKNTWFDSSGRSFVFSEEVDLSGLTQDSGAQVFVISQLTSCN